MFSQLQFGQIHVCLFRILLNKSSIRLYAYYRPIFIIYLPFLNTAEYTLFKYLISRTNFEIDSSLYKLITCFISGTISEQILSKLQKQKWKKNTSKWKTDISWFLQRSQRCYSDCR